MSELALYYNTFRQTQYLNALCKGPACSGWHLSEVDTWHECPCNKAKNRPHPEDDSSCEGYVVSYRDGGRAVFTTGNLEDAKVVARSYRDNGHDVRLHKAYGSLFEKAEAEALEGAYYYDPFED